ncbi:MAG TPA: hypothetical protein VHQ02_02975, partial [Usitatibacter sp.]|nr:hypothetical protein [Usitatibacter sp.]
MRRWIVGASMLCLVWVGSIPSTASAAAPSITAGAAHALAVRADGIALAWGANESGELGQGTSSPSSSDIVQSLVPLAVPGLANVASVAAMRTVAAAVTRDGHVYVWGSLGGKILAPTLVAAISDVRIVSITAGAFVALKNDGTVWTWSNAEAASLAPISIPGRVVAIAGGAAHALAVTDDGSVWSWGSNFNGQLGDGTTTDRPAPARVPGISGASAVAAGDTHSLAVTNDGRVWAWGGNSGAVLGNALGPPRLTPGVIAGLPAATAVDAKAFRSIALAADGTVWHWGDGPATPTQMPGVTSAAKVAAGNPHFMVILRSGTLMTWGINQYGEVGNGST